LQFVAKAAGLMAGFGVKLWPIVQNLSQLIELYPDNWETFLGNAGMWQVFAVNDQTTARYMSERLGEHIVWRKQRTFNQQTQKYDEEWVPQGASFLRTGIELGRETSRDSGNQVIFVEGGDSFLLRRRPYDRTFKQEQYSPDPSESGSSTIMGRMEEWGEGVQARNLQRLAPLLMRIEQWEDRRVQRSAEKLKAKQGGKDVAGK
jgi:type IV secretory pathway TraG/TraD family ATPase VirD4